MDAWQGWEKGRVVLVLSGVLLAGIWLQLTLMHLGGAFKRWQMWAPVLYKPLAFLGMAAAIATPADPWGRIDASLLRSKDGGGGEASIRRSTARGDTHH